MKAVVAAFNQEKALVGAFSVITNLWMQLFEALVCRQQGEAELGLAVALLDGEEQLYTDTLFGPDGLYGSKHLAAAWADTPYNARWSPALLASS